MSLAIRSARVLPALIALVLSAGLPCFTDAAQVPESISELNQQSTALAEQCRAATVGIMMPGGGMGSGVIISEDGLVLTAAHVLPEVGGAITIVLHDGRQVPARALGANRQVDSGMARITEPGAYPFAPVAKAGGLWEGDWCIAFGHAAGVQTDRPAPMRLGRIVHVSSRAAMTGAITTDCTVVSGDSGGPLYNMAGEVIGIHSNIEMNVLVNRHVPIDVYHAQWDALLEPQEISAMPQGAGEVVPGLESLPENIQREITRRLAEGDEALRAALDASRDDAGQVKLMPEELATLLGREDLIAGIREYEERLAERERRTRELNAVEGSPLGDGPDRIDERLAETRQIIRGAVRERALEEIADELRRAHGKIADHVLAQFDGVALSAGACTVEVVCQRRVVALGTIVRADGYIVTKASELNGPVAVRLHDMDYSARIVNGDWANDIAMLKIDAEGLVPVRWSSAKPVLGEVVVAPGADAMPLALGIIGVDARPIPERVSNLRETPESGPFLGVSGLSSAGGAVVESVIPGTPAQEAGLRAGDIIIAVGEQAIEDRDALVQLLGEQAVGQALTLTVRRGEGDAAEELALDVTLGDRADFAEPTPEPQGPSAAETYSARGGKLSERRTRFPMALTHDTILWAHDVGGPLLNLEGDAVGLNIARYGRTATYAIPADVAQGVVDRMLRGR
ncbi:MAG: trypsin-like peptidase domain-containing protein [Phycisphaerales bacterium JB063]